jgi:hypothetical protein
MLLIMQREWNRGDHDMLRYMSDLGNKSAFRILAEKRLENGCLKRENRRMTLKWRRYILNKFTSLCFGKYCFKVHPVYELGQYPYKIKAPCKCSWISHRCMNTGSTLILYRRWEFGLDMSNTGQGSMAGSCVHGNKTSGSVKRGKKCFGLLSKYYVLKKIFSSWIFINCTFNNWINVKWFVACS